jgi:subtilisin family serine protease
LIKQRKMVLIHRFLRIHHVWPDFKLRNCITKSLATIKADAAHRSFTAYGDGITWAVIDSGIQADHPHFRLNHNVDITSPYHADFTVASGPGDPFTDQFGHGTHVAGIIAGEQSIDKKSDPREMIAAWREFDADQEKDDPKQMALEVISGMAPKCRLISLKVLDRFGMGSAKSVISALTHVQEINHHGREIHIHGVNLSLGYPFEPKWFACGHSPLCVEVNRLAKSGVVVVIAAGNSGYGTLRAKEGDWDATLELTIPETLRKRSRLVRPIVTCRTCTGSPTFLPRDPPAMAVTSPIFSHRAKRSSHAPRKIAGSWSKKQLFRDAIILNKAVQVWRLLT